MLSMYVGAHQKDWDVYIPYVLLAYRSSVHASTADTPYFLMHGHDIQLPSTFSEFQIQQEWESTDDYRHHLTNNMRQIWDEVLYYNSVIKQQREIAAQKNRDIPNFQIGNLLWLYTKQKKKGLSLKLMHLWHGPYRIIELTSPVNAKLQTMNSRKMKQIVHVSRLRKYITPSRPTEEPQLMEDDNFDWEQEIEHLNTSNSQAITMRQDDTQQKDGNDEMTPVETEETNKEYEVQSIMDIKKENNITKYLIRWKGYSANEDSWEPETNLNCPKLIDMFHSNNKTLCNECGFQAQTIHGLATHTKRHK